MNRLERKAIWTCIAIVFMLMEFAVRNPDETTQWEIMFASASVAAVFMACISKDREQK